MVNGNGPDDDREPKFSFGTRELREARRVQPPKQAEAAQETAPRAAGFDPYNSSGTFDRRRNWERVGKR
jgi:hypothetical protein